MSRTVLVVAFTLLCLSEINGMYTNDRRCLARHGNDQGLIVTDVDESNGRELKQFDDKVIIKLIQT